MWPIYIILIHINYPFPQLLSKETAIQIDSYALDVTHERVIKIRIKLIRIRNNLLNLVEHYAEKWT